MDGVSLIGRLTARLRERDERGFTLVEVVIAITVIFGALLSLAYTATIGFSYESLARQKQTATGLADQVMEEVRGLAWEKITDGLYSGDLAGDPRIVDCSGVKRFLQCTADPNVPGSGERIVADAPACSSSGVDCVVPLIRHRGTITQNGIDYTWSTYVTNDCKTGTDPGCTETKPYRVTAIVTWTGGRTAPNKIVQVQSLFWSPQGCRSTATHPFAAPCQPFFYGLASVPQGGVNITGTISALSFSSGDLLTPSAQSTAQQEQLSQAGGSFGQSGVQIVDGSGTHTAGGSSASSAADTDPGTTTQTYEQIVCPSVDVPCTGGSVSASGASDGITLTTPGGDTGEKAETDSTTAAGGAYVCPPPDVAMAETDQRPCAGTTIQQGGALSAVVNLNGFSGSVGQATVARIDGPSEPGWTFVNRIANPTAGMCTPTSDPSDYGCIESKAHRSLGSLTVGGLPSGLNAPSGWTGSYFAIANYQATAIAAGGASVSGSTVQLPNAQVTGGTVTCWNGTNGYSLAGATSGTLDQTGGSGFCGTLDLSQTKDGHHIEVTITPQTLTPATTSCNPSCSSTGMSSLVTDASAQVTPPTASMQYQVAIDGVTVVNLTITVNLGTLQAHSVYAPPPSAL
jgi:prepilin-type N-terminal cleavage/methylation domain-containing protein